jgi:hypothetical protein
MKKTCRISRKLVEHTLGGFPIEQVAGHLDLEGVCYLKVVRSGAQELFVSDATSTILKKDMTHREIATTFWSRPAMEKWAASRKEAKR